MLTLEERQAIAEIFSDKYYQTCLNGINYASYLMLEIFEKMGILGRLKDKYRSCDELIAEFKFSPKAKYALAWMLSFLSQGGFLESTQASGARRYHYQEAQRIAPEVFLRKGLELDKNIAASANLISYVIGEYPDYFCGRKKGVEILFAQDKIALWNEYFSNNNSGYAAYNSLGAFGVLRWAMHQENIKLLEVGGGTAGGTCALLDKLKERQLLSRVSEYIFSDLSPIFLRLGNQAIMQKVPEDFAYSLKKLDFDKPLIAQGIKENDLGVVYGVNAIHVAKNLVVTLKNIYRVLKPGGMLIFSEYCRPQQDYLLFQEFIFCLLDNYVEVELDGALRPNPGFLDFAHWRGNLEAAGFKNIEAIFNTDGDYPDGLGRETGVLAAVIKAEK